MSLATLSPVVRSGFRLQSACIKWADKLPGDPKPKSPSKALDHKFVRSGRWVRRGAAVFLSGPALLKSFPSELLTVAYFDLLWVNVGWGIFNLLPMIPLDGGQVLTTLEAWILRRRDQLVSHALSFVVALTITGLALAARSVWIAFLGIWFAYLNGSFLLRRWQTRRDRKQDPIWIRLGRP